MSKYLVKPYTGSFPDVQPRHSEYRTCIVLIPEASSWFCLVFIELLRGMNANVTPHPMHWWDGGGLDLKGTFYIVLSSTSCGVHGHAIPSDSLENKSYSFLSQ